MRLAFFPPSVVGLGVALSLSLPASAAVTVIEPAPPATSATTTLVSGPFTDYFTFSLATGADLEAIDTVALIAGSTFMSGSLELYSGAPTSGTLVSSAPIMGSAPSGSIRDVLGAGTYYYEVAGTTKGEVANILTVAAIPELGTWAMFGLGMAALGFASFAKKGKRHVFVD